MALAKAERIEVPRKHELAQNFPNPFNIETSIQYSIVSDQYPRHVTLKIYNTLGQEIKTLVDEVKEPADYTVTWDGKDNNGGEAASGVYFYRLRVGGTSRDTRGGFTVTKRMVLMK
jgi:flagellar hook assembly protein FlgD